MLDKYYVHKMKKKLIEHFRARFGNWPDSVNEGVLFTLCGIRTFYLIVPDLNWGRFGFGIVCGHFDLGTFYYSSSSHSRET